MGLSKKWKVFAAAALGAYLVPASIYTGFFYYPTAKAVVYGQKKIRAIQDRRSLTGMVSKEDELSLHGSRSMIEEWNIQVKEFTLLGIPLYEFSTPVRLPVELMLLDERPQFYHKSSDADEDYRYEFTSASKF